MCFCLCKLSPQIVRFNVSSCGFGFLNAGLLIFANYFGVLEQLYFMLDTYCELSVDISATKPLFMLSSDILMYNSKSFTF